MITALLAISIGCGGSAAPRVKVLGVTEPGSRAFQGESDTRTLVLFLEVINPSDLSLRLSRLEYRFLASPWFDAAGEIELSRAVSADSAAVVEVPVRISAASIPPQALEGGQTGDVAFSLEGRLFARSGALERSWRVKVRGTLHADALSGARQGPLVRMHLASGH